MKACEICTVDHAMWQCAPLFDVCDGCYDTFARFHLELCGSRYGNGVSYQLMKMCGNMHQRTCNMADRVWVSLIVHTLSI